MGTLKLHRPQSIAFDDIRIIISEALGRFSHIYFSSSLGPATTHCRGCLLDSSGNWNGLDPMEKSTQNHVPS